MLSPRGPRRVTGCRAGIIKYLMATRERHTFGNHTVANQPPPLSDYNVFEADRPLVEAVARYWSPKA